jgi:hypothetical protein
MPIENFIVYQKAFDFFIWQKSVVKHLAKVHKYSLGVQIENESLRLLRNIVIANMARTGKAREIEECLVSIEILKILFRAAHELNREGGVSLKQYEGASERIVELGNLCGGWLKKFQTS